MSSLRVNPRYSVNATSLPHHTVTEAIRDVALTGGAGLGLWERKMTPGEDARVADEMAERGLSATFCVPSTHTILPSQIDGPGAPRDPEERLDALCASIRRLARFDPAAVLIAPGASGDPAHPAGPLAEVMRVLPVLADTAEECGVRIGVELIAHRRGGTISSLPAMIDVLDAIGRESLGIMFSVFHSWDEPDLHQNLRRYASRINSVQVCDIRDPERSPFDRELPGRGRGVAPGIIQTLLEAGYDGWWDLEIFSDDGTFGTRLPGSYWAMPPLEFLGQAKEAFDQSYSQAYEQLAG
jgi:sugar phosphate isomerase/epimerase